MTRGDNRACDHDMECTGKHTPCGIHDEDSGVLHIEFGSSAKTSAFLVDSLQAWWNALPVEEQQTIPLIQIKMDNGPESSGVRTQFLKRIVEWADQKADSLPLRERHLFDQESHEGHRKQAPSQS